MNSLKIMLIALLVIAIAAICAFVGVTFTDLRKGDANEAAKIASEADKTAGVCIRNQRMLKVASTIYQAEYEVITTQLSDLEQYTGALEAPTSDCSYEYIGNDDEPHAFKCKVESHNIPLDEEP